MVTLEIGNGNTTPGDFHFISWKDGSNYLKVELNPAEGSSYILLGTSEILSVTCALQARNAYWNTIGKDVYYNPGNIGTGTNLPTSTLHVSDTVMATTYQGDRSLLTGTGDSLGNHTATQIINLNGNS